MTQATESKQKVRKEREQRPCACGCERLTKGTWAPGHDAKFHSALKRYQANELTREEFMSLFPPETIAKAEAPAVNGRKQRRSRKEA